MARKRRKRGRRGGFKLPILSLAILGGQALIAKETGGDVLGALNQFQSYYTGIDIRNRAAAPHNLIVGWAPWLVKGFVGRVATGLGARPKIPFGLPISIS